MTTWIQRRKSLPVALAAVGGLLFSTGCGDRPITDLSQEVNDRPILRTVVAPGAVTLPGASMAIKDVLIEFDATATNAFLTATAAGSGWNEDNPFAFAAFNVGPSLRNGSNDPRLPALADNDAGIGRFFVLGGPEFGGLPGGFFDLFGEVEGLEPNTRYTVVMARMQLIVNGEPDQEEMLSTGSVTNPDQLQFLGGSEAGFPGVECNFTVGTGITASMNPVGLGFINTDANGAGTVDCVPVSTEDSPWWREETDLPPAGAIPDSLPFGSNEVGATLAPGQYNYVYLVEGEPTAGNPVPDGPPVLRAQVGPDLTASGVATSNGYRPFPTAKLEVSTADSLDLPGTSLTPISFAITAADFPTASFEVKVFSEETGSFSPALPLEITDAGGTVTTGTAFTGGGAGSVLEVVASQTGGVLLVDNTHLVVAVSGVEDSEFLFRRYRDAEGEFQVGALAIGGFDGADDNRTFTNLGAGRGEFFGDSLIVSLNRLNPTPPDGFHYQSYLMDVASDGTVTSMSSLHTVTLDELGNGSDRVAESEAGGNFANFNFWVMVLEADGASADANALQNIQIQVTENYRVKFSSFFN